MRHMRNVRCVGGACLDGRVRIRGIDKCDAAGGRIAAATSDDRAPGVVPFDSLLSYSSPVSCRTPKSSTRIPSEMVDVLQLATRLEQCHRTPETLARRRQVALDSLVGRSAPIRGYLNEQCRGGGWICSKAPNFRAHASRMHPRAQRSLLHSGCRSHHPPRPGQLARSSCRAGVGWCGRRDRGSNIETWHIGPEWHSDYSRAVAKADTTVDRRQNSDDPVTVIPRPAVVDFRGFERADSRSAATPLGPERCRVMGGG